MATELFIRDRKQNICLAFVTQVYFGVPNSIRLNSKYYFNMKIKQIKWLLIWSL